MPPLVLSFAHTFHMVKGSEFKHLVVVDTSDVFQPGMVYTAFSRARLLDKDNFIITHPQGAAAVEDYLKSGELSYEDAVQFQQDIEKQYLKMKLSEEGMNETEIAEALKRDIEANFSSDSEESNVQDSDADSLDSENSFSNDESGRENGSEVDDANAVDADEEE